VAAITELGVVGQGELVELGRQVVVAIFDAGVDVVERALDQVALGVGLEVDHVGLGQALAAAAERDDFQIGLVAVVGELGQQGVEGQGRVLGRTPLQRTGHAQALLVVLQAAVARDARVPQVVGGAGGGVVVGGAADDGADLRAGQGGPLTGL
jgi:hypothetical protein